MSRVIDINRIKLAPPEFITATLIETHQNLVLANGINAAKLFQLFIEKRVVTITAKINNATYNRTRIAMILRISVHQSFEFLNF
jgi:hypothetical protein